MMAPWALAMLSFWIEESQNKVGWIRCIDENKSKKKLR
jgi:hypothetical protein